MNGTSNTFLLTPGPVNIPWEVRSASSRPMLHHRTAEFSKLLEDTLEKMKILFGATGEILLLHATGRGAMEGVFRNLFDPGAKILCICNGRFGHMIAEIAEVSELCVVKVYKKWDDIIDVKFIEDILKDDRTIQAVTVVHSETSNAVVNPVEELGRIVKKHDRLFIVDAISSIGVMPFQFDQWQVDVAVTSSQKGLMAPAGISFVSLSDKSWKLIEKTKTRSYYINFVQIRKIYKEKKETPGTTPVSLVCSVHESLCLMEREGFEAVYNRHKLVSKAVKAGASALGFKLFPTNAHQRSHSVTALFSPVKATSLDFKRDLNKKFDILIASGLGQYKDSVMRIGHIGTVSVRDALMLLSVLEIYLMEMKVIQHTGSYITEVHRILKEEGFF